MSGLSRRQAPVQPPDLNGVDQHEFGALTEPYRHELQAHCYRMVGSPQDAEDLVQETFLRAWRRRETYEGRAGLRAWLYKIATNLCLDALQERPRRALPATRRAPAATADDEIPAPLMEPVWLEPYPDGLLAPAADEPEARFSARESITLAFVAALHLLPPRQRAVLILRDVLDWRAGEVAGLLGLSVPAVKSTLHRARATLERHYHATGAEAVPASLLDARTRARLDHYVLAWETADVDALLALLKADATFSMPPIPSWYQGHAAIRALLSARIFSPGSRGRWRLLPARANGQPAFGLYQRDAADGRYHAYGIQVLHLASGGIADITTFRNPALAARFGLPDMLDGGAGQRATSYGLRARSDG